MTISKECKDIGKLKQDYAILKAKYGLPDFEELEIEFDIEKVADKGRESKLILRDIRRGVNEKVSAYMHLFETFMNPSAGPIFVFNMLKNANDEDKKRIREIYQKLAKTEIKIFKLDTIYQEQEEAEFIKQIVKEWAILKKEIYDLVDKFDKSFEINGTQSSRKYFG